MKTINATETTHWVILGSHSSSVSPSARLCVPDPRRGFLLHCGTHIICMCISRRCPHRSLWAAASPRKMSYVIWKLFMKQYARLRLPSNNNSNNNGGRPTLIWHTYAAIEGTVRGEGKGLPDWEWQWKWKSSNELGYGNGNGRLRMGVNWKSRCLLLSFSLSLCLPLACLAAFIDLNWVICNKTRSQVGGWVKILLQINDANLCMSRSWNWEIIRKIDLIFLGAK